jgi:hypothetical protein
MRGSGRELPAPMLDHCFYKKHWQQTRGNGVYVVLRRQVAWQNTAARRPEMNQETRV